MAKILIVDDSFLMRKSIKKIVERMGHTVVGETFDGKFLMQKYIQLSPDLITLDIVMVEKNGIAALRDLKERYPDSKVIMVSSVSQRLKVLAALKLGADHFILKPLNEEKLVQVITEVLGESKAKDKENVSTEEEKKLLEKQTSQIKNGLDKEREEE